jgi:hypothetical protein
MKNSLDLGSTGLIAWVVAAFSLSGCGSGDIGEEASAETRSAPLTTQRNLSTRMRQRSENSMREALQFRWLAPRVAASSPRREVPSAFLARVGSR